MLPRIARFLALLATLAGVAPAFAETTGLTWWPASGLPERVIAPSGSFYTSASPTLVSFGATGSSSTISTTLTPPPGRVLQVGAYENTERWPFNGNGPGLDVTIGSSGCNASSGRFSVLEAVYDGNTAVRLAIDFRHDCMGVYGELRVNSTVPFTADRPNGWATPGPMAFPARTFLQPGAIALSTPSQVYGINSLALISIVNGEYSVNGGAFTSAPGVVSNRDRIRLQAYAPATPNTTRETILTVGGVSVVWSVSSYTTGVPVTAARFENSTGDPAATLMGVAPDWNITSSGSPGYLTLRFVFGANDMDLDLASPPGTILAPGAYEDAVRAAFRGTGNGIDFSGNGYGCNTTSGRFVVHEIEFSGNALTKLAVDFHVSCGIMSYGEVRINSAVPFTFQKPPGSTFPDAFAFAPRADVTAGTPVLSNEVEIFGTNAAAPISIQNGEYSINGGSFTSSPGTIGPRDRLRVRATAPVGGGTGITTITVGGFTTTFQVSAYIPGQPLTAIHVEGGRSVHGVAPQWSIRDNGSSRGYLQLSIDGPLGDWFSLDLASPPGQDLALGAYEGAARAAFRGASPGLDFSGNGSGCNTTGGRFAILDLEFDGTGKLSRLAADWEQTCDGTWGEIRLNSGVPLTSLKPPGSTLPDPMAFTRRTLAKAGALLLSNQSTIYGVNAPVPISITGGEYSVNGGAFTVAPGTAQNKDHVVVRMTASTTPGATKVATLNVGGRIVPFEATTYAPGTPLTVYSYRSTGDYIGGGNSETLFAPPNTITFQANSSNGIDVNVTGTGGQYWSVSLAAPNGARIVPGTYLNGQRYPFQPASSPGLSISGNGRGCNTVTGSFTVHEAVYNASGVLQQLAVDIEHRCEGRDPPLFAEVRLNSGVPIAYFGGAGGPRRKRAFDANGDGRADLLWQHTDGRQAMWLMENETVVGSAVLLPAASGWSIVQFGDFNGDGKSDILWRHTDGRIAMWLMDGAAQVGGGLLLAGGTGWTPLLIGDLDGDGKSDIVWTHPDGRSAVWLMNGAAQAGGASLLPAGTGWLPKLLADFDGNGKSDILWEHPDGSSALWIMDGTRQVGGGRLFGAGTGWTSQLIADLNGDGKSDIVWTHNDGRAAAWIMNGAAQVGGAVLLASGTGYVPILAGDIDGDGKDDIVWRMASGNTIYWLMNGTAQKGAGQFDGALTGFAAQRLVDFNGDRRLDLLGVQADGRVRVFRYDGVGFTATTTLDAGAGWSPTPIPER